MGTERPTAASESEGLEALSAAQMAGALGLLPHREGGYFRETYRSPAVVSTPVGPRALSTSILYLLTAADPSRFHRLQFDELWFFHAGAPVEMVFLDPFATVAVGREAPQALAPGGRWMGARVVEPDAAKDTLPPECDQPCALEAVPGPGPAWALVGCVVSPGFEYDDFEAGEREVLLAAYPGAASYIRALS